MKRGVDGEEELQVIDVEPKPSWADSEVSAYAAAKDHWFRGFLVYERIPGRCLAMILIDFHRFS